MSNRLPATQQPLEIQTIRLHKSNNGMGLSIVAAKVCVVTILQIHNGERFFIEFLIFLGSWTR